MLMEECKKQDKPYGLIFEDITGGYTSTRARGAQTFEVSDRLKAGRGQAAPRRSGARHRAGCGW